MRGARALPYQQDLELLCRARSKQECPLEQKPLRGEICNHRESSAAPSFDQTSHLAWLRPECFLRSLRTHAAHRANCSASNSSRDQPLQALSSRTNVSWQHQDCALILLCRCQGCGHIEATLQGISRSAHLPEE